MAGLTDDESRRPMVLVEWADAYADENTWRFIEDIEDEGDYTVTTIGWLLEVGDGGQTGHVSVAQSIGIRDDAVDHIINIPQGMVRKLLTLSVDADRLQHFLARNVR